MKSMLDQLAESLGVSSELLMSAIQEAVAQHKEKRTPYSANAPIIDQAINLKVDFSSLVSDWLWMTASDYAGLLKLPVMNASDLKYLIAAISDAAPGGKLARRKSNGRHLIRLPPVKG